MKNAREGGKNNTGGNGRREVSNKHTAACSFVLLDGNGAVAGC